MWQSVSTGWSADKGRVYEQGGKWTGSVERNKDRKAKGRKERKKERRLKVYSHAC